jgi:hypothetical protein
VSTLSLSVEKATGIRQRYQSPLCGETVYSSSLPNVVRKASCALCLYGAGGMHRDQETGEANPPPRTRSQCPCLDNRLDKARAAFDRAGKALDQLLAVIQPSKEEALAMRRQTGAYKGEHTAAAAACLLTTGGQIAAVPAGAELHASRLGRWVCLRGLYFEKPRKIA